MSAKPTKGMFLSRIGQASALILTILSSGSLNISEARVRAEVRLVLQITIDGLRADLINCYEKGFGKGGFRLLMDKGAVFTNAHYQYADTATIAALLGMTPTRCRPGIAH